MAKFFRVDNCLINLDLVELLAIDDEVREGVVMYFYPQGSDPITKKFKSKADAENYFTDILKFLKSHE